MNIGREITPNRLFILSVALFVLSVFVAIEASPGSNYLILASAIGAVSGVIFTSAVRLHSEQRDTAFKFVQSSAENESLFRSMRLLRDLYREIERCGVDREQFALAIYDPSIETLPGNEQIKKIHADFSDPNFITALYEVGNFFEQIYIAIKNREINEEIIYSFYCGMFIRYYNNTKDFLPTLRNTPTVNNHSFGETPLPELFTGLDDLASLWLPKYYAECEKIRLQPDRNEFDNPIKSCSWTGRPCTK